MSQEIETPKMNPEIRQLWIDALLSDKYKQGKMKLRDCFENFCCLGVLCDLHAKATGKSWNKAQYSWQSDYCYLNNNQILPLEVREWAGLELHGSSVRVVTPNRAVSLTEMNDNGMPFKEIARVIKENL